jgi:endoglucanase
MLTKFVLVFATGLIASHCPAQNRQPAFAMNERLGRGINMGNSFEAPTETAWGNPWSPSYFRIMSELGFNHVRVPVRWETPERSLNSPPYTIKSDFLNRIQEVVNTAIKNKLHVVINMHHHDGLFENPSGQKERFLSQWYQIADHFKSYSDSLVFEVLNEPHGNVTTTMWNEFFAGALAEIRKTNPTRTVLMGVADFGGLSGISKLEIPDDDNIILSAHYYNPFPFTHQGAEWVSGSNQWLGTEWLDTDADRKSIESEFNYPLYFAATHHIPIHIGEFGAFNKADMESRKKWTTFLARWFEQHNMSWAYWEFSATFGIYNPVTQQTVTPLVNALLHNEMPEATPSFATSVYNSNFSVNADGWTLSQQGGASGNTSTSDGKMTIAVTNGGTLSWQLQLIKTPIQLKMGKLYQLTFTGKSEAERNVTFYAGKATSPWSAYSGASAVTLTPVEASYSFAFKMSAATDLAARLVFDLGANDSDVTLSNIKVEELSLVEITANEEDVKAKTAVYPNPVSTYITIENADGYDQAELLDLSGRSHGAFKIINGMITLREGQLPAGLYVLSLHGQKRKLSIKVIKN